jgi:hypothetical protein
MADKEYTIRIVCDELSTPLDWTILHFKIPEAYLDKIEMVEGLVRYILARFGDKIKRFKIGETLLGYFKELGYLVDML